MKILNKNKLWLFLSLLFVICIVVWAFWPSLFNDFVNWDDNILLFDNPSVKGLTFKNLQTIFSTYYIGNFIPLTLLSFSLEHYFCELTPFYYHLTNLILHTFNSLLVFWFIYLLVNYKKILSSTFSFDLSELLIPVIVAVFFGIHPMHVEAVAWVTERKSLLFTLFYLSGLISYIFYLKRKVIFKKSLVLYLFTLLFFILSVLSKPVGMSFPFILFLLDWYLNRKKTSYLILEKIPFLAIAGACAVISYFGQKFAGTIQVGTIFSLTNSFFLACYGLTLYICKLILPVNLSNLYQYPAELSVFCRMSPLVLIIITAFTLYSLKYTKKIFFGFLFFLICIAPVLKILPYASAVIDDRQTYLSSIGLFFVFAESIVWLWNKKYNHTIFRYCIIVFLCLITLIFSIGTRQRCRVWKNTISLWSDAINKDDTLITGYINRGEEYLRAGKYSEALYDFNKAIVINPVLPGIPNNIGVVHHRQGNLKNAVRWYSKALDLDPSFQLALLSRGEGYYQMGNYSKASNDFINATINRPNEVEGYIGLGMCYRALGNNKAALLNYNKTLELNSSLPNVWFNRGNIFLAMKDYNKAVSDYTIAISLHENYAVAYYNRGICFLRMKNYKKALNDIKMSEKLGKKISSKIYNLFPDK